MRAMSSDLKTALCSAHRANIDRYRQILRTHLSDEERQFVERQIAEEEAALRRVAGGNVFDSVG